MTAPPIPSSEAALGPGGPEGCGPLGARRIVPWAVLGLLAGLALLEALPGPPRPFPWLLLPALLLLLVLVGFGPFRWGVGRGRAYGPGPYAGAPDALEIARRRYAGGEIDRGRFREILEELRADR